MKTDAFYRSLPSAISSLPYGSRGGLGWGCLCFSTQLNLIKICMVAMSAFRRSLRSHPTLALPCKQGRGQTYQSSLGMWIWTS